MSRPPASRPPFDLVTVMLLVLLGLLALLVVAS